MKFEFTVNPTFSFVNSFAEKFGLPVMNNMVSVPKELGSGYIKLIELNPDLKFVIHHFRLKEDFFLKRLSPVGNNNLLSIVFYNKEIPVSNIRNKEEVIQFLKKHDSSIQISSSALATETLFPKNTDIYFVVIGIQKSSLKALLEIEKSNSLYDNIINGQCLFYYCEELTDEIEFELKNLTLIDGQADLSFLLYRIKIQKLLYLLFQKLLNRDDKTQYAINKIDLEKIAEIRTLILKNISTPPLLKRLSKMVGMSETKMKKLFKQVYGQSIYNYYEKARMNEAVILLRHREFSVTEVGYQLGFSNLSHFSRIFKKYHGLTPKAFTKVG